MILHIAQMNVGSSQPLPVALLDVEAKLREFGVEIDDEKQGVGK